MSIYATEKGREGKNKKTAGHPAVLRHFTT
jgi:hypothetical protein